ncbi:MAG: NapC/NirT family cytochrome c [bacterium]
MKKRALFSGLVLFFAGVAATFAFNAGIHYTNEMEFCTSCHSMQTNLREYKETVHYKNASGVRAVCSDCHVPKAFFPKMKAKILAYKDVLHEVLGTIDTPEKYEEHRWGMANAVWKKMRDSNSRECRSCHEWDQMALEEQSKRASKRHKQAQEQNKNCIDCHAGIAHEEPDEPDEDEDEESPAEASLGHTVHG